MQTSTVQTSGSMLLLATLMIAAAASVIPASGEARTAHAATPAAHVAQLSPAQADLRG